MFTYNLSDFRFSMKAIDKEVKHLYSAYSKKSIWHDEGKRKFEISKTTLTKLEQKIGIININNIEYYHIRREQIIQLLPKNDNEDRIFLFYLAILIWGYPNGGRGKSVVNILHNREKFFEQFQFIRKLPKKSFQYMFSELNKTKKISGMGPSTFTKILHFMGFKDKTTRKNAMIYDLQIIDILNRKNIKEANNFMQKNGVKKFKQNAEHYGLYCNLIHELAEKMNVSPEATEIFLFLVFKSI